MKAYFVWTVVGPQIILTSCDLAKDADCLARSGQAISTWTNKAMAYEVPLDSIKQRYGGRFEAVIRDPNQTDLVRVLDSHGEHVLGNIHFGELGQAIYLEPETEKS